MELFYVIYACVFLTFWIFSPLFDIIIWGETNKFKTFENFGYFTMECIVWPCLIIDYIIK